MPKLSVIIIAHNEEQNILRCLESVKPVADEIVVVDSMSTDQTARICNDFGCKVYQREFDGYGTQKQYAADRATNDWVFSVDADEVVSEELRDELKEMFEDGGHRVTGSQGHRVTGSQGHKVTGSQGYSTTQSLNHSVTQSLNHSFAQYAGFNIPFSLFFMGRILRHGGVGNEVHLRIFDRTKGGFTRVPVHEGIEVTGAVGSFHGRIIHYSYRDISHHLDKINTYTSQAAEGYRKRGKSFSGIWAALKFPTSFFSFYFIKLGCLDGYPGFMWSFLAAVYATLKVAKTIELEQKP